MNRAFVIVWTGDVIAAVLEFTDKLPDAISRFIDVLIGVEVNFFFLEGADQPFGVLVLPRTPSPRYANLQVHDAGASRDKHLKDTELLDQDDGSQGRFGVTLLPRVSRSEIASNVDLDAKLLSCE